MCFVYLLDWHVAIDEFYFILRRGSFFTQSRFHKKQSIKSITDFRQDKKGFIFFVVKGQLFSENKTFFGHTLWTFFRHEIIFLDAKNARAQMFAVLNASTNSTTYVVVLKVL